MRVTTVVVTCSNCTNLITQPLDAESALGPYLAAQEGVDLCMLCRQAVAAAVTAPLAARVVAQRGV